MSNSLTLFEIDDSLLQLLEAQEELQAEIAQPIVIVCVTCRGTGRISPFSDASECPACRVRREAAQLERAERQRELAEVEQLLVEYREQLAGKIDRVRGFLLQAEVLAEGHRREAQRQTALARQWESRAESVKEMAAFVISSVPERKRLQGSTGYLLLKGNGGLQPLVITDPQQVPDECCKYIGWIGGDVWPALREFLADNGFNLGSGDFRLDRVPDNERMREAMKNPCPTCEGKGFTLPDDDAAPKPLCVTCQGTGKDAIPGAHLAERGKHIEVR